MRSFLSALPEFFRLRNTVTLNDTKCPVCAQPVELRGDKRGYKAHDIPPSWRIRDNWVHANRRCWASGKGAAEIQQIYRTFESRADYYDSAFSCTSSVELVQNKDGLSVLAWSEINDEISARVLVQLDPAATVRFLDEAMFIAERAGVFGLIEMKERHR